MSAPGSRIVLFVNDSLFAYYLARPLIDKYHTRIVAVVFSERVVGSFQQVISVFLKTHLRYFVYRSWIDVVGRLDRLRKRRSIGALVAKYGLTSVSSRNVNQDRRVASFLPADIGIAFNFDQVLKRTLLEACAHGVLNVHAGRLPQDKGISPALWAFARGDASIWASIYRMGEGIDTGEIFRQIETPVEAGDTAFAVYQRVCQRSGEALLEVVDDVLMGVAKSVGVSRSDEGSYWGWPDRSHGQMMKRSGRRFVSWAEVIRTLLP